MKRRKSLYSRTKPIDILNLPTPLNRILINAGIKTVGKFYKLRRKKMLRIKGIGNQAARFLMSVKKNFKLIPYFEDSSIIVNYKVSLSKNSYSPKTNMFEMENISIHTDFSITDPIETIGLPTRTENTLKINGVETIGELFNCSNEQLKKYRNFGDKTVQFLEEIKKQIGDSLDSTEFVNNKPNDKSKDNHQNNDQTVDIPKELLLELLIERAKDTRSMNIIKRRYGLSKGEKETLEEIGKDYSITRERVRQIQKMAIKKIQHPSTKGRRLVFMLVEDMMLNNEIVISDYEADNLVPKYFNNSEYDGSSFLDLLSDLRWIQKNRIGDVSLYAPKNLIPNTNVARLMNEIHALIKNSKSLLSPEFIIKHFNMRYGNITTNINLNQLILRLCRVDPRIEEKIPNKLGLYTSHPSVKDWRNQILEILSQEGLPLHFTEISDKINEKLSLYGKNKIEVRRVHSILIESPEFSHSGVRGTYGLSKWGLRKEMTPILVEECLKNSGVPLHWKQIFNYVKKYKDTKEANILSILNINNKFIKRGRGEYALRKT